MARKKRGRKHKSKKDKKEQGRARLKPETKNSLLALFSFVVAVALTFAAFDKAGVVGEMAKDFLETMLGRGFWAAPLVLYIASFSFLKAFERKFLMPTILGTVVFLVSALGFLDLMLGEYAGGYIGRTAAYPLLSLFDFWVSAVVFSGLFIASILVMLNVSFNFSFLRKDEEEDDIEELSESFEEQNLQAGMEDEDESAQSKNVEADQSESEVSSGASSPKKETDEFSPSRAKRPVSAVYAPPPLKLLEDDRGTPSSGDVKANANVIKRTLQNFGIDVEMFEVNIGPSVTQYTLKPAEGIKLSRITALQSDLALALAAHPLRIEAPIPGKSLVGIEVPNRSIALVGLRSLLSMDEFQNAYALTIVLGRDVSGKPVFADIARMPHLLIAGATGSGKSIAIHTLITSLLYKNSPEFLRFLMIDPKRVELTVYNEIPHMLTPVITDAKKAVMSLRWAVKEMERRYEILSGAGVRNLASYNSQMLKQNPPAGGEEQVLPNIIIIIDELADLMGTYPREVEASVVRLAQMSRAVGIHLIVSTQRPSVEVITGLIKANITARVALQVASGVDSRTILDMSGAEKLLGNGDMLYLAGDTSKPKRIQGAFISEKEVKKVSDFVANQSDQFAGEEIDLELKANLPTIDLDVADEDGDEDELYEQAKDLVVEAQKASASYLQRRLRVGYARAARLLDILEERGIIGPGDGAKPREVLVKSESVTGDDDSSEPSSENKESDLNNF